MVSFLSACSNGPVKDEKVSKSDTLSNSDTLLAKKDSLLIDTVATASTQNSDTVALSPSKVIDTRNVRPDELVSFAETLIGTPYVYASTNPKVGFDCSGFITYVFNHFGISVPRSSIDFTGVGNEIPVNNAKKGDIILFTGTNPQEKSVGHMGIVVSNTDTLRFIHSTSGKAMSVTITPLSSYYMGRFVKTIRVFPQNNS